MNMPVSPAATLTAPVRDWALPEPARFGRVAVVMGGWSAERDVSLMSGQQVFDALVEVGVDAQAVDAGRDIAEVLARGGFDRAFLILHGGAGEGGTVQAAMELAGIPYTGSGVLGSALSMDKRRAKTICTAAGVPTPESLLCDSAQALRDTAERFGLPLVVKPTREGSSLGVTIVRGTQQLDAAFEDAASYGDVLVERFMSGIEVTSAVLDTPIGRVVLPAVSMSAASGFYDYDAKYLLDDTTYICPAPLSAATASRIEELALTAFDSLDCRGWARIDFMLDETGEPQFIECNTAPGMTGHSLVPMAAAEAGLDFPDLCLAILATTLDRAGLNGDSDDVPTDALAGSEGVQQSDSGREAEGLSDATRWSARHPDEIQAFDTSRTWAPDTAWAPIPDTARARS